MIKELRHISYYILIALLMVACREDDVVPTTSAGGDPSDIITLGIAQSQSWNSGAANDDKQSAPESATRVPERHQTQALPLDCEGDSLLGTEIYMYLIEEDLPTVEATQATTRDGDRGERSNMPESYGVYAYKGKGNNVTSTYMDNLYLNENVQYTGDRVYYWPGSSHWLRFFPYSPYIDMTGDGTKNPSVANDGTQPKITYTVPNEISSQMDLLAGAPLQHAGDYKQTVSFTLGHILSKIQIKVGTISAGTITSVSIKDTKNSGTYTFVENPTHSVWNSKKDGSVSYTLIPTEPQVRNTIIGEPMYLMPQALGNDVKIEIKLTVTSTDPEDVNNNRTHEYTLTKQLNLFDIKEWQPGKQYTYVISTPQEVDVDVKDDVVFENNCPVKKNLQIKNTGLADAYIRVSLVGAWYVDNQDQEGNTQQLVVGNWKPEEEGEFVWNGGSEPTVGEINSHSWCKCDDGYYYYMTPLPPGETANKLFESYTLTSTGPMPKSYLEFSISVQAVHVYDANLVWPVEIQDLL